jgi:hypothetical protein
VAERYGVWVAHDRKCKLCGEPVEYVDLEIDHYFPEHLQDARDALSQIINEFALPDDFEINSFANWVPAHTRCNRDKSRAVPTWVPKQQTVVADNMARAAAAARKAAKLRADASGGRTLAQVLAAIETRMLTITELVELVDDLIVDPTSRNLSNGAVFLEDGRMFAGDEIVKTCACQCDKNVCVGRDRKMWCIFTTEQSDWVVATGLFHACYDELVACSRCGEVHRRGYVGRHGSCAAPFANQHRQSD